MDDALALAYMLKVFSSITKEGRDIFQMLRENKLRSNGRKCEIAMKCISHLGFQLSSNGVTITDDKIKIIKALKPQRTRKL